MLNSDARESRFRVLLVFGAALAVAVLASERQSRAQSNECLVEVQDAQGATVADNAQLCGEASNKVCTFPLKLCLNEADGGCTPATMKKKVKATGHCGPVGKLFVRPSGNSSLCGSVYGIRVRTKKKGKKEGKCNLRISARSTDKPARVDIDKLTLVCKTAPGQCPTTTTVTTATTSSTVQTFTTTTFTTTCVTQTTFPSPGCQPIVPGCPIQNTYVLQGTTGEKRCTTSAASNRFGTCSSDTDCGGTASSCMPLPWVTADGQEMPFPSAVQTTFAIAGSGTFPACEHDACVPCGNPNAPCLGIPGCEVAANPNGCVPRGTQGCCDQPGFIVPTFFVNILGGLCSRVDQIGCGTGVVNTSNPQTGDNDVKKEADTSDPGPDCTYDTGDDPVQPGCTLIGQGNDYAGKIVRTIGNGSADAAGIHFRLITPELSTTWQDGQSPPGTCANGSKFDDGEGLISQIVIKAEPTSAGASGAFVSLGPTADTCKRAGTGFTAAVPDGPISVPGAPAGPARPQSYDGTVGSVTTAVSEVFSGPNSPIRDIGFVAITPNMPAAIVPAVACNCTITPGCPE